ncbi:MAG: hypothetical protein ABSB54_15605 [Acidimicrobiales bacterium]
MSPAPPLSPSTPDFRRADVVAELRGPDGPLTMAATAGVLGGLCGVELELFGWLGRAAPSRPSPGEVVWASAASLRAAWRASELETLMPVSVGLAPTDGRSSPAPAVAAGLALLAAGAAVDQAVPEAALAWYDVLLEAYRFRLERRSAAADGPLARVLERVATDLEAERSVARRFAKAPGRYA